VKRLLLHIVLALFLVQDISAQLFSVDSLKRELANARNDTLRMLIAGRIANQYEELNYDSLYHYATIMYEKARKLKLRLEEATAEAEIGYAFINMGNYTRALQALLDAIAICTDRNIEKKLLAPHYPVIDEFTNRNISPSLQRKQKLSRVYQYAGILYSNANNLEKAIYYFKEAVNLALEGNDISTLAITYATLGRAYNTMKKPDSALIILKKSYALTMQAGYERYLGTILLNTGRAYLQLGQRDTALYYFRLAISASEQGGYPRGVAASELAIADAMNQLANGDSSLYHIRSAIPPASSIKAPDLFVRIYTALANYYKTKGNNDSAVKYQSLIIRINDSLFSAKQAQQFQNLDFDAELRQKEMETAKAEYRNKLRTNFLLGGLAVFLFIAMMFWRNAQARKSANVLLSKQKKQLEDALATLQATQNQLIQSEKMASLGEMTAGIAHEIQNPLNFVNNFSEVNKELIEDMEKELNEGRPDEAKKIAKDIADNEDKIMFHGKRADAIVKSMLQHSRTSTGKKELTDINSLADEYLRLAYHGLRARDKSFNADFKSNLDPSIGKVSIIPQDIGRVLLNLINNAFYAVTEKKKRSANNYRPEVTLTTKRVNKDDHSYAEISLRDNGDGIPQKILDKIFQPFFTTKPTGEGTGLGLSLSYDIITKGHAGEMKVETKEGEGSNFVILLPI
jgi:two-component system, NtrC family, sensor kinase